MKVRRIPIGILVLLALIVVSYTGIVLAQPHGGHHGGGFWAELTEEQREAVHEMIKEMRGQGATREEIRVAVQEMLEGWGIELPEHPVEGPPGGPGGFWAELTEEQREAIHEKMEEMRSQGATREEIRAAIQEMLEGWGIELPNHFGSNAEGTAPSEGLSTSNALGSSEGVSPNVILQSKSYPNPFNSDVNIAYTLNAPASMRIQIHDVAGRLVRDFDMGVQEPGAYSLHWDGTYENGASVTSGVYFYRVEAGTQAVNKPMILLTLK